MGLVGAGAGGGIILRAAGAGGAGSVGGAGGAGGADMDTDDGRRGGVGGAKLLESVRDGIAGGSARLGVA